MDRTVKRVVLDAIGVGIVAIIVFQIPLTMELASRVLMASIAMFVALTVGEKILRTM